MTHDVVNGTVPGAPQVPPAERVAEVLAKQEIQELIYRRARAADRRDVELAQSCYHDGATEDHGGFIGPATEFLAQSPITWTEKSPIRTMWHFVSNTVIDLDLSAGTAFAESYCLVEMDGDLGEGDVTMIVGSRYLDRFAWRDGRWRISARTLVFDWSRVDPATVPYWVASGKALDRLPFGRPDHTDPLHRFVPRGPRRTPR